MSEQEIQDEEREALLSIYEGDEAFKQVSPTVFQYKYGENDNPKSFLVEVAWGTKYPSQKPTINMDTFYNRQIALALKSQISRLVLEEADQYLGMSMTYSLFEFVREKFDDLIQLQCEEEEVDEPDVKSLSIGEPQVEEKKKVPKKEQLTKAQKRRQWDKVGDKGERPRGWNWVDIVKHLSQTGAKDELTNTS